MIKAKRISKTPIFSYKAETIFVGRSFPLLSIGLRMCSCLEDRWNSEKFSEIPRWQKEIMAMGKVWCVGLKCLRFLEAPLTEEDRANFPTLYIWVGLWLTSTNIKWQVCDCASSITYASRYFQSLLSLLGASLRLPCKTDECTKDWEAIRNRTKGTQLRAYTNCQVYVTILDLSAQMSMTHD